MTSLALPKTGNTRASIDPRWNWISWHNHEALAYLHSGDAGFVPLGNPATGDSHYHAF
jgi:hypothetical protein